MALCSGCIAASLPRGRIIIDAGPRPGRPGHRRRRRRTRRPSFRSMGHPRAPIARGCTAVGVAGRRSRAGLALGSHADPAVRPHRRDAGVANLGRCRPSRLQLKREHEIFFGACESAEAVASSPAAPDGFRCCSPSGGACGR